MTESRSRSRRATRKSGSPETAESPTFQAPEQKQENGGRNNRNRGRGRRNNSNNGARRNVVKSMQGADLTERLPLPPKAPKNGLRITALGGISEIGRNMTVFEYNNRLLIVDCGVLFPSSGEPGVDLILPDFGPIEDRINQVEALVVTHGHEDHIGAIPWLLKLRPDLPILASKFTLALIAAKCREHRQRPKLIEVNEKSNENRGPFNIRFWAVNHSIPDCLGVAIKTGAGLVVHTGDIKLDQTPTDGRPTDLPALSRFGDEGVDLLLCDSTNATTPGVSGSEAEIAPTLKRIVAEAKQRVILASFASNVYRVQAAVDAAVAAGRKVAFNGRSMIRNMEIAEKMGYLKAPRGTIISMDDAAKLAPHKVLLITTGTQGEPMAALSRMARREHRQITVRAGDVIILSSSLVPGNEEAVFGVINMLSQIGATVITGRDAKVHTSGHGYSGELLFLYNAARPVNAMPVHGEWRHLRANKELAISTGVDPDRVVLAQNGVVVDLVDGRARVVGQIPVGNLYVDGVTMGDIDTEVLEERTSLGEGGLIAITAVIDNRTGRLVERPRVEAKGFSEDAVAMMPEVAELVENTMNDLAAEGENDPYRMVQQLRRKVSRYVEQTWRRKPMIMPTVFPVTSNAVAADDSEVNAHRPSL
ncbi:ribonuclease J [Corynebacterium sp. 153RC1]|uniref:ribonuclease J n=1 Tax=Corynebacterium TaxID=1716 RepID=UPI00211CF850|nr:MULTISPECIES: ribonuclease J [unclassified Corynebacterium]MCQ9371029.1 ribonuclease J [Corynebacterium sp. 35RC1]MCQ9342424.1 ribonuclease J [Corynebacterium sp. 76QC2CO]MCQ9351587.1 ribonuclease J [Corynebacterium sp. 209RC1]MCQ9353956.1 ribonuclease J [Corynebacterium sp. 1222RC1]MCQ9355870.1 ribonuclease J [Corynebacterium sp. 122RC1]